MMIMTMKLVSCTFLLIMATATAADGVFISSVRGLKSGGGSGEMPAGMEKGGVKMNMMKTKKGATSGKKAGMMGGMKGGGKMMGNGGMKAKKGMESKIIMESISIGNRRPEGITSVGGEPYVYTSEIFYGGIKKVNLETGESEQIVEPFGYFVRGGFGMDYYKGAIFVAGGGPGAGLPGLLYVYDSETGEDIAACAPTGNVGVLNDVIVYEGKAYVTDSAVNSIMVVDADAALKGECIVSSIELSEELFLSTTGEFLANGIVDYEGGLLVARSLGGLFYVDLDDESVVEVLGTTNGDGLVVDGDTLYINESTGIISVWRLSLEGSLVNAEFERSIMSDLFDFASTSIVYGDYIVSVNARFGTAAAFTPEEGSPDYPETFNVVSVYRFSE
jgi:sugar lactone lactonase YvrE